METKLTEQLASNDAIDVIASALIALPGGADAAKVALRKSAEAKLKKLGLTIDEIQSIIG